MKKLFMVVVAATSCAAIPTEGEAVPPVPSETDRVSTLASSTTILTPKLQAKRQIQSHIAELSECYDYEYEYDLSKRGGLGTPHDFYTYCINQYSFDQIGQLARSELLRYATEFWDCVVDLNVKAGLIDTRKEYDEIMADAEQCAIVEFQKVWERLSE